MGNKMCASWQKPEYQAAMGHRGLLCQPLPARKHLHLIRLWAEIFEVCEENGRLLWSRVWDEVVPVNVICIQDNPYTVYQITAYDQLVKKIFDVQIVQPGTLIVQTSECFVHWNDPISGREWGLNFTRSADARQFLECCTARVVHGLSRKASSSESLRPKSSQKQRSSGGHKMASNQSSPTTHHPHCAMSISVDESRHCVGSQQQCSASAAAAVNQQLQVLSVCVDQWCRENAEQLSADQNGSNGSPANYNAAAASTATSAVATAAASAAKSVQNTPQQPQPTCSSDGAEPSFAPGPNSRQMDGAETIESADENASDRRLSSCKGETDEVAATPGISTYSDAQTDQKTSSRSSPPAVCFRSISEPASHGAHARSAVVASESSSPRRFQTASGLDLTSSLNDGTSSENSGSVAAAIDMELLTCCGTAAGGAAVGAAAGNASEEDIYDVVGGGDVDVQETVHKFYDDDERDDNGSVEKTGKSLTSVLFSRDDARGHQGHLSTVDWNSCNRFVCPDVVDDATGGCQITSTTELLDITDWPPPPRWQNDSDDCTNSPNNEELVPNGLISDFRAVTGGVLPPPPPPAPITESSMDGQALQRLIDSIPPPESPASDAGENCVQQNQENSLVTDVTSVADEVDRRRCDVDADSLLDTGSGSPDEPQDTNASADATNKQDRSKSPDIATTSATSRNRKTSNDVSSGSRSRTALTVSVISADSGCSSQSDAAVDAATSITKDGGTSTASGAAGAHTAPIVRHNPAFNVWTESSPKQSSSSSAQPQDNRSAIGDSVRFRSLSATRQRRPSSGISNTSTGRPPSIGSVQGAAAGSADQSSAIPDLLRTRSVPATSAAQARAQQHYQGQHQQPTAASIYAPMPPLVNSHRIGKVVLELLDTERQYVRDLVSLIYRYLEPLRSKAFVSRDAVEQLLGNISKIVHFHAVFLHSLENVFERTAIEFGSADDILKLLEKQCRFLMNQSYFLKRRRLLQLHMKTHYMQRLSLMTSSGKVLKSKRLIKRNQYAGLSIHVLHSLLSIGVNGRQTIVLEAPQAIINSHINMDGNAALQEFLRSCNPRQQHSVTLESYLIKPIQRILKYPLLLGQLVELTEPRTEEHQYLNEALRGMQAVAEHMNEMQKIYDEFGAAFDEMSRDRRLVSGKHRLVVNLNVCELQMYGTVRWMNASDALGKLKKGSEVLTVVFIFKSAIAVIAQEQLKVKSKKSKLLSVGQSGKAVAAVLAATGSGSNPTASGSGIGTSSSTPVNRFQMAMPIDQIQVRTVVGDQCERHAIWEIAYCWVDDDGRPRKMVYKFLSSYKARNDFIRAIHHTIHDSVCHSGLPTMTSLAGLQMVTPVQQRCVPMNARQSSHPANAASIYGELPASSAAGRCGMHQQPSDVATYGGGVRRRSIGGVDDRNNRASSTVTSSTASAAQVVASHYGTVPYQHRHQHHQHAAACAVSNYGLYGTVPVRQPEPGQIYDVRRPTDTASAAGGRGRRNVATSDRTGSDSGASSKTPGRI